MENSETFCVSSNSFESDIKETWKAFENRTEYSDVTLACEDDQIEAHKLIVSSCSPVLKKIFQQNLSKHPLIYMRGVQSDDLKSLMKFIYHGEVYVDEMNLNRFLSVADDLQIRGLYNHPAIMTKRKQTKKARPSVIKSGIDNNVLKKLAAIEPSLSDLSSEIANLSEDSMTDLKPETSLSNETSIHKLECQSLLSREDSIYTQDPETSLLSLDPIYGPYLETTNKSSVHELLENSEMLLKKQYNYSENYTISEDSKINGTNVGSGKDLDFNPMELNSIVFPCVKCDAQFKSKNECYKHNKIEHEGFTFPCDSCDYMARQKVVLKVHIESIHEGVRHPCSQCDFKSTQRAGLYKHVKKMHKNNCTEIPNSSEDEDSTLNSKPKTPHSTDSIPELVCQSSLSSEDPIYNQGPDTSVLSLDNQYGPYHEYTKEIIDQHVLDNSINEDSDSETYSISENSKIDLDSNPTEGISTVFPCLRCGTQFKSKNECYKHNKIEHEGFTFPCDSCDYVARQKVVLKVHIESIHEGIRHPCSQCDFKSTQRANLYKHVKKMHKNKCET